MLNEKQMNVVRCKESKVLVNAAAAAGKTACLIARIEYLLKSGVPADKIVAITFTNNAAAEMYARLGRPENLFIGTVHSYCNYLLRAGGVSTSKVLEKQQFDELFSIIKKNKHCIKEVDHLIVDEAMDSTKEQFEFFELIHPKNFMYFYDIRQSIYGFADADPDYLIRLARDPEVVTYRLNQNYRNEKEILSFAKRQLWKLGDEFADDSIPMRTGRGSVKEGQLSLEGIADLLKNETYGDWFILCRTNQEIQDFLTVFNKKKIPCDTFKQGDLDNAQIQEKMKENTVKILTIHSAKGLEAKKVLVYNPIAWNDEGRRLLYVAATRARDELLWIKPLKKKKPKTYNW